MNLAAAVEIDVPFYDVDPMLVVWHGHYAKYCEVARCALLRKIDYDYPRMEASGYHWPIVEMHLKYVGSARYGQRLRAEAQLLEYENRLKLGYRIVDAHSGQRLTKGWSIQVAIDAKTRELQFVSPPALLDRLAKL